MKLLLSFFILLSSGVSYADPVTEAFEFQNIPFGESPDQIFKRLPRAKINCSTDATASSGNEMLLRFITRYGTHIFSDGVFINPNEKASDEGPQYYTLNPNHAKVCTIQQFPIVTLYFVQRHTGGPFRLLIVGKLYRPTHGNLDDEFDSSSQEITSILGLKPDVTHREVEDIPVSEGQWHSKGRDAALFVATGVDSPQVYKQIVYWSESEWKSYIADLDVQYNKIKVKTPANNNDSVKNTF